MEPSNEFKDCCDLVFLALIIWREARGEGDDTKLAVGYSVMARITHAMWWGWDIQSVMSHKWQYSSFTDPNDLQLTTWPLSNDPSWKACLEVAQNVLNKSAANPAPGADSYFNANIPTPSWATHSHFIVQIGGLRFYQTAGDYETN